MSTYERELTRSLNRNDVFAAWLAAGIIFAGWAATALLITYSGIL